MIAIDRKPELFLACVSVAAILMLADALAYTIGLLGF